MRRFPVLSRLALLIVGAVVLAGCESTSAGISTYDPYYHDYWMRTGVYNHYYYRPPYRYYPPSRPRPPPKYRPRPRPPVTGPPKPPPRPPSAVQPIQPRQPSKPKSS